MQNASTDFSTDAMVRDSAVRFRTGAADLAVTRRLRNTLPGFDPARLDEMKALGWFGTLIDEAHGGIGLGFAEMAVIVEELGRGLLAEPLLACATLPVRVVMLSGNAAAQARLLPGMATGERLAACAWQEQPNRIDPAELRTTASTRNGRAVLNGRKRFVAGAAWASGYLVSAVDADNELAIYWVDADRPGLVTATEWRADGSPATTLTLSDVAVGADDLLCRGEPARAALARAIDETNVVIAAELLGNLSENLDSTLAYLREREQFGQPIGKFQVLQHKAADLFIARELTSAVVHEAAAALDAGGAALDIGWMAGRAKARAGDSAIKAGRDAVQMHGAFGFTDDCNVGLFLKRAMVLNAWLGSPAAQRRRLAGRLRERLEGAVDRNAPAPMSAALRARFDATMAKPAAERDWNGYDDEDFRSIAADFFQTHLPAHLRYLPRRPTWDEVSEWYRLLGRTGWLAPSWPAEHGGMGLMPGKLILYFEEMGRAGAPKHLEQGVNHIGPLLIARGSPEQKAKYLPKILSGEHIWCQGYSEPGAGSDLASLRTRAERVGDEFVINGQKIWTTMAHHADYIYLLARTGSGPKKQQGISFLLADLNQPGITITPIRNIAGQAEFCQVFFDDARTPVSNLVGELDDGWRVSRALLGFERLTAGSPRYCQVALARLRRVASAMGLMDDPRFVDRLCEITVDVEDLGSMYERAVQGVREGRVPGPEISILKILATETLQRVTEALVESAGELGAIEGDQTFGDERIDLLSPFLDLRSVTISAGSSQIQRNVLATRVLGL